MNIALVNYYSLYEAITRNFFAKVLNFEVGMDIQEFNSQFHSFYYIIKRIVKGRYQVYLPKHIFLVIDGLRQARNYIVHLGRKVKPEFEIIEKLFAAIVESF